MPFAVWAPTYSAEELDADQAEAILAPRFTPQALTKFGEQYKRFAQIMEPVKNLENGPTFDTDEDYDAFYSARAFVWIPVRILTGGEIVDVTYKFPKSMESTLIDGVLSVVVPIDMSMRMEIPGRGDMTFRWVGSYTVQPVEAPDDPSVVWRVSDYDIELSNTDGWAGPEREEP